MRNNVSVTANTGSNTITSSTGESTIITGQSAAAANVVNVINTNIINSRYLLLAVNNFSRWIGDLIFPGKSFFAGLLGNGNSTSPAALNVSNGNSASIANNVEAAAGTGGNSVGAPSGIIITGSANSAANVVNVANTNITNSDQVYILVRVFGTWTGSIFSVPPGVSWRETPSGILLYSSADSGLTSNEPCCGGSTNISNTNSATVQNNVNVIALTGYNEIKGDGAGVIATGDAAAAANIMNIANTNIVGRNMLLALVNIFGDWEGNLSFGKPDLWLGLNADVSQNPLTPGSGITYHLNVANRGNADATNVRVESGEEPRGLANVVDFGGGRLQNGKIIWEIPRLGAGESRTLSYRETVSDSLPLDTTPVTNAAQATSYEPDADPSNNSDYLMLAFQGRKFNGVPMLPKLTVKETNDTNAPISPETVVHYKTVIDNDGLGIAYRTSLRDVLYDPWGNIVTTNTWDLGDIYPSDEIIIEYSAKFNNASSGYYINYAYLDGFDDYGSLNSNLVPRYVDNKIVASSTVYVNNPKDQPAPVPPPLVILVPSGPEISGPTSTQVVPRTNSNPIRSKRTGPSYFIKDVVNFSLKLDLSQSKDQAENKTDLRRRTNFSASIHPAFSKIWGYLTDYVSSWWAEAASL